MIPKMGCILDVALQNFFPLRTEARDAFAATIEMISGNDETKIANLKLMIDDVLVAGLSVGLFKIILAPDYLLTLHRLPLPSLVPSKSYSVSLSLSLSLTHSFILSLLILSSLKKINFNSKSSA
jgi:hypothetical protein